jgi:hypothetical protein
MVTPVLHRGTDEIEVPVRLSQIPLEVRQAVAHELARKWKLKGVEYTIWLLAVSNPRGDKDVELVVPYSKYERVIKQRKRVRSAMPPGLAEILAEPPRRIF